MGVGCTNDLLAWRRGSRVGCRPPEWRGRAAQAMSVSATWVRLEQGNVRGAVCVQGSDVLATPDIVIYLCTLGGLDGHEPTWTIS